MQLLLALLLCGRALAGTNEVSQKFLNENGKRVGVVTLASGLQYKVLREGQGQFHPLVNSPCSCHYAGTTPSLTPDAINKKEADWAEFDSSYKRGSPTSFAPNQVIRGWTEAMQLMVEGDKWEMYIPSDLGYGDGGSGPKIKGGDVLIFRMEILKIQGGKTPAAKAGGGVSVEHEKHAAHIAQLTSHSWNIFRYVGDYLHLFGVFVLLATLLKNGSLQGISKSTQILYFLVFITRYLDLVDHSQTAYLVFFKLTYILTSIIVLIIFWKFDKTYERQKDTCSLAVIFVPCFTASILLANEISALEMLWTFSQFLEGFAMVPQYIFCYRDRLAKDYAVSLYVMSLGGYRVFYAANWIYKKIQMPHYSDIQSWIGGFIEICFFTDYLLSRFTGYSVLRAAVLKVDEKINEFQEQVELKVLGSSSRGQSVTTAQGTELRHRGAQIGKGEGSSNQQGDDLDV